MRFMFIIKTDYAGRPPEEFMQAMHNLADREIRAGRMVEDGGLAPLATGGQVSLIKSELKVIDGPFAEAKEVIGGYAVFELPGKEEAIASAMEFMQMHKDLLPGFEGVCEVRQVVGSMTKNSMTKDCMTTSD